MTVCLCVIWGPTKYILPRAPQSHNPALLGDWLLSLAARNFYELWSLKANKNAISRLPVWRRDSIPHLLIPGDTDQLLFSDATLSVMISHLGQLYYHQTPVYCKLKTWYNMVRGATHSEKFGDQSVMWEVQGGKCVWPIKPYLALLH